MNRSASPHRSAASSRFRPLRAVPTLALSAAALLLAACGGAATTGDAAGTSAVVADSSEAASVRSYTVRGVVRKVPADDDADRSVHILHEAIPSFVDREGEESGMPGMTMPFPPADGLSLEGIAAGDWVEIEFTVDWENEPALELTAIRKIDPAGLGNP